MSRNKRVKQFIKRSASRDLYDVDIVTPVYGAINFLSEMIASLLKYDAGVRWSLTLVDDAGPERRETEALYSLLKDSRIRVVRNPVNSGFAAANNLGFSIGDAPLLLMLNSDTLITHDGWLENMRAEFDDGKVGIVGARLLFFDEASPNYAASPIRPVGKTQHAGVAFNMVGNPFHIFFGWDPDHEKVTARREMSCVTGACLMTRRKLYESVRGLDTDYGQGNFEDVQFCLQMKSQGHKIIYNPNVTLKHFAGGSNNNAVAKRNLQIFQVKCRNLIDYDDWRFY